MQVWYRWIVSCVSKTDCVLNPLDAMWSPWQQQHFILLSNSCSLDPLTEDDRDPHLPMAEIASEGNELALQCS